MTRNSRELSQFASFVEVRDANKNIGINTSLVVLGGVGIGSTVGDYLTERSARGSTAVDSLINFNESYFLDDVYIDAALTVTGDISLSGVSTFTELNVSGLATAKNLVVTGVTTLSRDTGMGTVHIGQETVNITNAGLIFQGRSSGIAITGPGGTEISDDDNNTVRGLVVIDNNGIGAGSTQEVALYVSGKAHFNGSGAGKTEFVVGPESLFYEKTTSLGGITVDGRENTSVGADAILRVFNKEYEGDWTAGPGFVTSAIFTTGGLEVDKYGQIGYALSVCEYIEIGAGLTGIGTDNGGNIDHLGGSRNSRFYGNLDLQMPRLSIGMTPGDKNSAFSISGKTEVDCNNALFSNLIPNTNDTLAFIGSEGSRWFNIFGSNLSIGATGYPDSQANMVNLDVGLGATIAYLNVAGIGNTDENEVYLEVGSGKAVFANVDSFGFFNHVGVATINGFLNVISDGYSNAFVATAFQANNVDLYKQDVNNSTSPEFFYPAMGNAGTSQTDAGGQLFVNPGFYLDAFSTSLFVHNNLNVLGTAINASEENPDLRFDLLNYGVTALNIASGAQYIDIGQAEQVGSFTTIRSEITELTRLKLTQNDIQASTGDTSITLVDNTLIEIAGYVQIGGTYIKCDSNTINIADTSQRADLFKSAEDVVIGADDLGIATIRNNITELTGFLRLGRNVIQASDGTTAIEVGTAATYTEITGDLVVGGSDIQDGIGITNITMVGDTKTILYGDLEIRGNEILSSDSSVNILMFDAQELTSFTGDIRVEGNNILAGTGDTNITMVANNNTIFAGPIQVNGDIIRASNGQDNITMDSDILTTVLGDLKVGTGTMRAGDGIIAIKMQDGTGNVGVTSDLTANSAFFNGAETRLNTQDVNIRDNLLTLGLIEDPLSQGTLIPPNVAVGNTGDVGILMARYDIGISTHKYAGIFYDNSQGRIAIRTDVNPDPGTGEEGRDRYVLNNGLPSELEIQNLYININNNLGIKTIFEANTIDTGEEVLEVLNVMNVELDAGFY